MASNPQGSSRYTATIDLTSRAQRVATEARIADSFTEPDPPLPDATPDNLPPRVKQALAAAGWPDLMQVQTKAIPYILDGRDLIVQSRTGSGKTGAFVLPLFKLIDPTVKSPQALILTPTRELARQIHEEFERMRTGTPEQDAFQAALVYGGVKYAPQTKALRDGAQVVIGTPGRILDLLERRTFNLDALRILVLDEADEMLSMGFYPAMRQLKGYLPRGRHSYMFSATIPPKVQSLAHDFLSEPGFLSLSVGQISVAQLTHRYFLVDAMEKDRVLARLIELENPDSAIIFTNTKREVEYLTTFLKNFGYDADAISGDLTQKAREAVMDRIRDNSLRFLVATDVAARGIDISDLSHVIMYDVPNDPEYYVHRSGRTARAGKTGTALVLTTPGEERTLLGIARRYGIEMEKLPVPTQSDVEERVSERITEVLEDLLRERTNLERERLKRFIPLVSALAAEEPELLAMLVDRLYHKRLHEVESPAAPAAQPAPEDDVHYSEEGAPEGEARSRSRRRNRGRKREEQ